VSKIKTSRIQGRTDEGTLTIGSPTGGVTFEGDVVIPNYPTLDYIEDIVSGDIAVELNNYQRKDEKNQPQGYPGLDSNGQIALSQVNLTPVEDDIADLRNNVNDNTSGVAENKQDIATNTAAISTKADQSEVDKKLSKAGDTMSGTLTLASPERDIDVASGTAGHLKYAGDDKIRWGTKIFFDATMDGMGNQITNISGPIDDNDAVNRYYCDNASKNISGPVRIDADYTTSDEVVFGIYVNLTRAEAVDKGFNPDTDAEGGAHSMEPNARAAYALFRVMGEGTIWAFNRIKGVSATPGADFDVTNMEYVDSKVSAVVARIASLEAKLA